MPKENESTEELLEKVNKEGEVTLSVEDILRVLLSEYDRIAEIHVSHLPKASETSYLIIKIHSAEAESIKEYLESLPSTLYFRLHPVQGEPFEVPVDILPTYDGPGNIEGREGTTVYREDFGGRHGPRNLDEGIRRMRKKLSDICPECDSDVEDLLQHYRDCEEVEGW
jgi:hypothetical protein